MSRQIPKNQQVSFTQPSRQASSLENLPGLEPLCHWFEQATGWSLRYVPQPEPAPEPATARIASAEDPAGAVGELVLERGSSRPGSMAKLQRTQSLEPVRQLALAIRDLLVELQCTRHSLWQREAELAAGIPIRSRPDEQQHLALRLQTVLQGGAQAVGCQAAAMYLLDESGSRLKLRASWGLAPERYLEPARPLREAAADLEALVGRAVVLEDPELLPHWRIPENCSSAVCVPVSSPTAALGTLWMFCDQQREFSDQQTNLIEIIAGRLATELEREMLLQAGTESKSVDRQLERAAQWQADRLPRITPLLDDWQVAGWTSTERVDGDFYDWGVLSDGDLMAMLGAAHGAQLEAALSAATLHAAVKSHSGYRHNASQLLQRVNETLWTSSAGDQFASLFYAKIRPESGQLEYCGAGCVAAWLVRPSGLESLRPHASPLGAQPENRYPASRKRMAAGDLLVVVNQGPQIPRNRSARPPVDEARLAQALAAGGGASAAELVQSLRALLAPPHGQSAGSQQDTVLVVKRR